MMKIDITTTNDAFAPDQNPELSRILRALADRLDSGLRQGLFGLYDINGNRVGTVDLVDEHEGQQA